MLMKNILYLLLLALFLGSCGAKKTVPRKNKVTTATKVKTPAASSQINDIIQEAKRYQGTRYQYGGTTKNGMDCSGLIYVAFKENDVALPRVSRDMAKKGSKVSLSKAKKGDLVFFQTNKNRTVINHVGLVTSVEAGVVKFIHSSSSRGVIISSLDENYWKSAFVEVRRII